MARLFPRCTVYVDDMYTNPMGQFGRMKMSHMWAPDFDDLHKMADAIGLARRWFQANASTPHYDVSMSLRTKAIELGAEPVTMKELVRIMRDHKRG